jgi:hypothetical protein
VSVPRLDDGVPALIAAALAAGPDLPDEQFLAQVRVRLPWYAGFPFADLVGIGSDRNGERRATLACTLYAAFGPQHRALIRFLLEQEVAYAEHAYNNCYTITLITCSLMLFKLGQAEDALSVWDAKCCCFDAEAMIDAFLTCGAGVPETLRYLRALETDASLEAAEYLEGCEKHGDLRDLESRVAGYEATFRLDYAEALESCRMLIKS